MRMFYGTRFNTTIVTEMDLPAAQTKPPGATFCPSANPVKPGSSSRYSQAPPHPTTISPVWAVTVASLLVFLLLACLSRNNTLLGVYDSVTSVLGTPTVFCVTA